METEEKVVPIKKRGLDKAKKEEEAGLTKETKEKKANQERIESIKKLIRMNS